MTDPVEIITFLTDRIDEAERTLRSIVSRRTSYSNGDYDALDGGWYTRGPYGRLIREAFRPEMMLIEIQAKRARIELHTFVQAPDMWRPLPEELPEGYNGDFPGWCDMCSRAGDYAPWPCLSLRLEAAPYIDHAHFNLNWRIDVAQ